MFSFDMLYTGIFTLEDDSEHLVNFENRWADKEKLAHLKRFTLVPKDGVEGMPVVVLNVPTGAKPIFKHRVYGQISTSGGTTRKAFRVYCIGYKLRGLEHLFWILPNGIVEIGPDPLMAMIIQQNAPFEIEDPVEEWFSLFPET
jgi:hypothetical protein